VWRCLDLFDELNLPAGAPDQHHGVRLRAADRGGTQGNAATRFIGHGPHQRRTGTARWWEADEKRFLEEVARRHRKGLGASGPRRLDGAVDELQPSHA